MHISYELGYVLRGGARGGIGLERIVSVCNTIAHQEVNLWAPTFPEGGIGLERIVSVCNIVINKLFHGYPFSLHICTRIHHHHIISWLKGGGGGGSICVVCTYVYYQYVHVYMYEGISRQ